MSLSVFDVFKIGIGPSSSHTVGPMRAAKQFLLDCKHHNIFATIHEVTVQLYGSLALTGKGHGSDKAVILGWNGYEPDRVDQSMIQEALNLAREENQINLNNEKLIRFDEALNILFLKDQFLPGHPNGMRFTAFDQVGNTLFTDKYFSIGGGFITKDPSKTLTEDKIDEIEIPYRFTNAAQILEFCQTSGLSFAELGLENEKAWRSEGDTKSKILNIWQVMQDCVKNGFKQEGHLPGGLNVKRRAPELFEKLDKSKVIDGFQAMDWLSVYALSVNEENASGGRVVTAPTNGAAGIIPAVIHYYRYHMTGANDEGVIRFLLVAGMVGMLYKMNASISGAEMGCQGEVGVACSMAAAGLVAALNGTNKQIENAAEIGMEHNLGLTCDPIGGLVQIPCIERNAMGSVKAVSAARMAMHGDGSHKVSLDQVIETMRQTGNDMSSVYKETSQGGLAVNVTEC